MWDFIRVRRLSKLLRSGPDDCAFAADCLSRIGPRGTLVLTEALEKQSSSNPDSILWVLGNIGDHLVLPSLLNAFDDSRLDPTAVSKALTTVALRAGSAGSSIGVLGEALGRAKLPASKTVIMDGLRALLEASLNTDVPQVLFNNLLSAFEEPGLDPTLVAQTLVAAANCGEPTRSSVEALFDALGRTSVPASKTVIMEGLSTLAERSPDTNVPRALFDTLPRTIEDPGLDLTLVTRTLVAVAVCTEPAGSPITPLFETLEHTKGLTTKTVVLDALVTVVKTSPGINLPGGLYSFLLQELSNKLYPIEYRGACLVLVMCLTRSVIQTVSKTEALRLLEDLTSRASTWSFSRDYHDEVIQFLSDNIEDLKHNVSDSHVSAEYIKRTAVGNLGNERSLRQWPAEFWFQYTLKRVPPREAADALIKLNCFYPEKVNVILRDGPRTTSQYRLAQDVVYELILRGGAPANTAILAMESVGNASTRTLRPPPERLARLLGSLLDNAADRKIVRKMILATFGGFSPAQAGPLARFLADTCHDDEDLRLVGGVNAHLLKLLHECGADVSEPDLRAIRDLPVTARQQQSATLGLSAVRDCARELLLLRAFGGDH